MGELQEQCYCARIKLDKNICQKSAHLLLFSLDILGCYEPLYLAEGTDAQGRQSPPPRGTRSCVADLLQGPPISPHLQPQQGWQQARASAGADQDMGPNLAAGHVQRLEATVNSDAAFHRVSFLCSPEVLQTKKKQHKTHTGDFLSVGALYSSLS